MGFELFLFLFLAWGALGANVVLRFEVVDEFKTARVVGGVHAALHDGNLLDIPKEEIARWLVQKDSKRLTDSKRFKHSERLFSQSFTNPGELLYGDSAVDSLYFPDDFEGPVYFSYSFMLVDESINGTATNIIAHYDLFKDGQTFAGAIFPSDGGAHVQFSVCVAEKCHYLSSQPTDENARNQFTDRHFMPYHLIGSNSGGNPFEIVKYDGNTWSEVTGWCSDRGGRIVVKSIRFHFSDGTSYQYGNVAGSARTHQFAPTERVTAVSLFGNGIGTRSGNMRFRTTTGADYDICQVSGQDEYVMNIGSGIVVGFKGRAGHDVDQLGIRCVKYVGSTQLINVRYPDLAVDNVARNPERIDQIIRNNCNSQSPVTITREYKEEVIESYRWSVTTSVSFKYSHSVKASLIKVVEISTGFEIELGAETTYEQSGQTRRENRIEIVETIPPRIYAVIDISQWRSNIDVGVEALLNITFLDGDVAQIRSVGVYQGVDYSFLLTSRDDTPCK